MDNKIAVGQRIMAGLPGTEIDEGFRTLVRECKIGNVILFRRNIESREHSKRSAPHCANSYSARQAMSP